MVMVSPRRDSRLLTVLTQSLWKKSFDTRYFSRGAGLLFKGKITQELIDMLMSWRHSGFNVHCGQRIQPGDEEAMEKLAMGCNGGVYPNLTKIEATRINFDSLKDILPRPWYHLQTFLP